MVLLIADSNVAMSVYSLKALSLGGTPPCQILTNGPYGDPSIRHRQTAALKQRQ
jgi:hypothetical protein